MSSEISPSSAPSEKKSAPGTPTGIISTQGLAKVYGKREVAHDVSLEVRAGEVVGLLGPNGAGKTTTFYMVVGLVPATRGRVLLDGNDITSFPMWKRARCGLGYLPQDASIFRKLTVWENVMSVVETMQMPASERKAYCEAQLNDLGLMRLATQPAYTLSGGERRRLEIARAGDKAALHAFGRTVQRRGPDFRCRCSKNCHRTETKRYRRFNYGPQRPRNPFHR